MPDFFIIINHAMKTAEEITPLAERARPGTPEEFVGQSHLMAQGRVVNSILRTGKVFSMILWGDPGTGKTTLARLIARHCGLEAHYLSAISSGVADVRTVLRKGRDNRVEGRQTLLFIDEIHRFNKTQQDSILGAVEAGDVVLVGATTENPSFQVIAPLLSRVRVLKLERLNPEDLQSILANVISRDPVLERNTVTLSEGVRDALIGFSGGDARRMLNILETAIAISGSGAIDMEHLREAAQKSVVVYDRAGDRHYDTVSAFIKSLRGSDPDAAIFYMAGMIAAGEDPEFIARRMIIFASEDVGNASPQALNLAVSTLTAVKNIGLPECDIILSQCAAFLASSPKSNASYNAIREAQKAVEKKFPEVPLHLRNAPTGLMKRMGYARDYKYPHDYNGHFVKEEYLPGECKGSVFYRPTEEGSEKAISERLKRLWPERYK